MRWKQLLRARIKQKSNAWKKVKRWHKAIYVFCFGMVMVGIFLGRYDTSAIYLLAIYYFWQYTKGELVFYWGRGGAHKVLGRGNKTIAQDSSHQEEWHSSSSNRSYTDWNSSSNGIGFTNPSSPNYSGNHSMFR